MRKRGLQGTGAVFRFSLSQQCAKTGWRLMTLLPALLLLIGIPLTMVLVQQSGEKEVDSTPVAAVFVADETGIPSDYGLLNGAGDRVYSAVDYVPAADAEAALAAAGQRDGALALLVELGENGYELTVIRPEGSPLSVSDAKAYTSFLQGAFPVLAREKSGLTEAQLSELCRATLSSASTSAAWQDESLESGYEIVR